MIDCDFPGGNIIAERIDDDDVFVRQDLRDTDRDWFYWYFRVTWRSRPNRAVSLYRQQCDWHAWSWDERRRWGDVVLVG